MTTRDDLLSSYIDGRLSPKERQQVEATLACDPAAQQRLAELRYTVATLAETPRAPLPRAFTLNQSQATAPRRGWRLPGWLQPAYLRSAAALVAVLLLVLLAGDMSVRSLHTPAGSAARPQPGTGAAPADQGDPTDVIGKRATGEVAAQPAAPAPRAFLGLTPGLLLALEIALGALLVVLLVMAWQVSRAVP